MNNKKSVWLIIILSLVIIVPIAWNKTKSFIVGQKMAKLMMMPTKVSTTKLEMVDINESAEYVGRVEAEKEVKIVSRVSGWLEEKYFQEGDYVKEGQLLFLIEPDEYQLNVKNAQAELSRAKATYNNAEVEMKRAKELVQGDYVSKSYYDNAFAQYSTAKAAVESAIAKLNQAKLNLSYTQIKAPHSGKIGQMYIQEGNYVTAQTGELATLVTMNPIYTTFTVKSEDLMKYQRLEGNDNKLGMPDVKVGLKLTDGSFYNEPGILDFVDNKIDKDLGTIMLRATFENKNGVLIPNDFVRVELISNVPTKAALIQKDAVLENVNGKYVWVVGENNTVQQKDIEVSGSYKNNWIVKNGLTDEDEVICSNLQSLRTGMKVQVFELTAEEKAKKEAAWEEAINSTMTQKPNQKNKKDKAE